MNADVEAPVVAERKPKDYASDQEVRWCPGCGDYAILKAMEKLLADLQADPDRTVFISGIGCAARFPYYLATYGFHTIHGRAAAIATGVKLAQPDLDVWVVSGDGDSLSIGGNHLLHLLRRNIDVQYLLFNNEIYGLTKGQYSPTSRAGTRSPSSPGGSLDQPVHAASFALGAGARFVARAVDVGQPQLIEVLKRAHAHRGTSFVEILQNCIVYNDGIFDELADKKRSPDHQIWLQDGQPMIFGKDRDRGLRLQQGRIALEVVELGKDGVSADDLLVHDETDPMLATLLSRLAGQGMPTPLGVLYCDPAPSFEERHHVAEKPQPLANLDQLFRSGNTWTVT